MLSHLFFLLNSHEDLHGKIGERSNFVSLLTIDVRRGSHQGGSPQDGLGDERTCGTTLALAYVLRRLSAAWSQLQMKERESEWK